MRRLNHQEQRFVDEYLVCLKPKAAALAAGYAMSTAKDRAAMWVTNPKAKPHIYAAIQEAMENRSKELHIEARDVLRMWWTIAQADPRELIKYKRGACRHCWGEGFSYQFVDGDEYAIHLTKAAAGKAEIPKHEPTFGYTMNKKPNPKCPHCAGDGHGRVVVEDTSTLSPEAAMLYEGVQVGKDGIRVHMRNRSEALLNIAKHIGMLSPKQPGEDIENPLHVLFTQIAGNALPVVSEDPDFSDDEE